jgi:hypothetical protein
MKFLSLFVVLVFGILAQNTNDLNAIAAAHKGIAQNLMNYYTPSVLGTIPKQEGLGAEGFQWFEMGFFCN